MFLQPLLNITFGTIADSNIHNPFAGVIVNNVTMPTTTTKASNPHFKLLEATYRSWILHQRLHADNSKAC